MKKTIAIILVLVLAGVGLFAAVPADHVDKSFTVTTTITPLDLMAISTATFSGTTQTEFTALEAFTNLPINSSNVGVKTASGYISTLSNNRKGFSVNVSATAMSSLIDSNTKYINYVLECGTATLTTNSAAATTVTNTNSSLVSPNTVVQSAGISEITSTSTPIWITVNKASFDAAVAGSYTGTVTFNYVVNS